MVKYNHNQKITAEDCFFIEQWLSQPHLVDKTQMLEEFSKDIYDKHLSKRTGWTWRILPKHLSANIERLEGLIPSKGPFKHCLLNKVVGKPFVVRAFPEFNPISHYQPDSKDLLFPFYDGLRITMYKLPFRNGLIWGKTDRVEYLERVSQYSFDLQDIIEDGPFYENLKKMVEEEGHRYAVSLILYGSETSSRELALYKTYSHNFVVTHIEDITTHKFLPHEETIELCEKYQIPIIESCNINDKIIRTAGGVIYQKYQDGEIHYFTDINPNVTNNDRKELIIRIREGINDFADFGKNHQLDVMFKRELEMNDKFKKFIRDKDSIFEEIIKTGRKYDFNVAIHEFLSYHTIRNMAISPEEYMNLYKDSYFTFSGLIEAQTEEQLIDSFNTWKNKMGGKVTSREYIDLDNFIAMLRGSKEELSMVPPFYDVIKVEFRFDITRNGWTWGTLPMDGLKDDESWDSTIFLSGAYKHTALYKINAGNTFVVRGFPDYQHGDQYAEKDGDKIFPDYNGTRITLFTFPSRDEVLWGKTDSGDYLRRQSVFSTNYHSCLEEDPNFNNIENMIRYLGTDYAVSGILFGDDLSPRLNEIYRDKHKFIVTHIEDMKSHQFLSHEETIKLCDIFKVNVIKECEKDSDMINEVGGYLIQRFEDGEIEYFNFPNTIIDIERQMVNEIWEKVTDHTTPKEVEKLINEQILKWGMSSMGEEYLRKSLISHGKKPNLEIVERFLIIHKDEYRELDFNDFFEKQEKTLTNMGLTELYHKNELKRLYNNWKSNL